MLIAYILENCGYSIEAETIIKKKFKNYKLISVPNNEKIKNEIKKKNKMNTFPQIFINYSKNEQMLLGGYDDLVEYIKLQEYIKQNKLNNDVLFLMHKYMK
jgi:glutaredoxin-related protein